MKNTLQIIIICSVIFCQLSCTSSRPSPYLEKAKIEYFSTLAEEIIAQEFPHIDFEGFYCCDVRNDKNNNTYISGFRDSDREEYEGQLNYCHDNFTRETITVIVTESKEMLSASIKKQRIGSECIDLMSLDLTVK
jgi:transposase